MDLFAQDRHFLASSVLVETASSFRNQKGFKKVSKFLDILNLICEHAEETVSQLNLVRRTLWRLWCERMTAADTDLACASKSQSVSSWKLIMTVMQLSPLVIENYLNFAEFRLQRTQSCTLPGRSAVRRRLWSRNEHPRTSLYNDS